MNCTQNENLQFMSEIGNVLGRTNLWLCFKQAAVSNFHLAETLYNFPFEENPKGAAYCN